MKVTITKPFNPATDEKSWSKPDGRSGVIRTQEATAECAKFRQTVRIDIGKNEPFPVGEYTLDLEDAISVGDFGDLKLARRLPLVPLKPAAAKAA
ncbi:hypothetical protein [Pseudoluteimonas lycopersici]|nr:hypothetical protein [Lysobacter lycopersici]